MRRDYLPDGDSAAYYWMHYFLGQLAGRPGFYGVDASAVEAAAAENRSLRRLLDGINTEGRTPNRTFAKNRCRAEVERRVRKLAMQVKFNADLPDIEKRYLSLRPPGGKRRRIVKLANQPGMLVSNQPALAIAGTAGAAHLLRYRPYHSYSSESSAKPEGAVALQVFLHVGGFGREPLPEGFDVKQDGRYGGTFTRTPFRVQHDQNLAGRRVTYWGRWIDRRGNVGQFSPPVSMCIAA